jgi:phosphoglycolate phosphatase
MIRLVLFDIDGTLIRTTGAGVKAFAKVFETEFNAVDGFEQLKFAGRTDVSLIREFFAVHGIAASQGNFTRFYESYYFWLDHLLHECACEVCPGVWDFLEQARNLPSPPLLGLLTGNLRLGAEIKLRHLGLWDVFQTGAFADDHEERDCIAAVAKQRGSNLLEQPLNGDDVLVIGDTPLDVKCGRAINARVLAVATGGATLEELQQHKPDWLVPDLRSLPTRHVILNGSPGAASRPPSSGSSTRPEWEIKL